MEIKFRGIDIITNEWAYGYYFKCQGKCFIKDYIVLATEFNLGVVKEFEVIPETVRTVYRIKR